MCACFRVCNVTCVHLILFFVLSSNCLYFIITHLMLALYAKYAHASLFILCTYLTYCTNMCFIVHVLMMQLHIDLLADLYITLYYLVIFIDFH